MENRRGTLVIAGTVVLSGAFHIFALVSASQLEPQALAPAPLRTISVELIEMAFPEEVQIVTAEEPEPVRIQAPQPAPRPAPLTEINDAPPATAAAANVLTTDAPAESSEQATNTIVSDSESTKLGSGLVSRGGLALVGRPGASRDGVLGGSGKKRTRLPLSSAIQQPPKLLAKAAPTYPRRAKRRGMEGDIKVALIINEQGAVARAKILSGPSIFHESVLAAVMRWRFTAPYDHGRRVSVRAFQTINFSIAN